MNTLLELPTISNFVVIKKKTSHISKADKVDFKQNPSNKTTKYRHLLDFSLVNACTHPASFTDSFSHCHSRGYIRVQHGNIGNLSQEMEIRLWAQASMPCIGNAVLSFTKQQHLPMVHFPKLYQFFVDVGQLLKTSP